MKRLLLLASVVAVVALACAPVMAGVVFSDDFDTGIVGWTNYNMSNPITWDATKDCGGSSSSGSAASTMSVSRIYRSLGINIDGYFSATWWIYDDSMSRAYGEIRATADGTFNGSLVQLFDAGKYNNVSMAGETYDSSYYQGRILYGSSAGWFNLKSADAPKRSAGWHKFTVERFADNSTNFYVDNILCRSFTGAAAGGINVVVLGFGTSSSSNGNAWFDGVNIAVPEPGSILAFASGLIGFAGLALRRRSA